MSWCRRSQLALAVFTGALASSVTPLAEGTDDVAQFAVDTHGYTDFAMGLARALGFDLCPRLAHLRDRRLHGASVSPTAGRDGCRSAHRDSSWS
ncbi:hypothetical protein DIE07_04755 [Burkholderia sp. Bp9002]|nr:hypothetical protein DIE07_04755 [Burkholderia sp. Bp9002]